MKMRLLLPLVLALAGMAGCGAPAGPDGPGRLLSFSARKIGGDPPIPPEVNVVATGGRLEVVAEYSSSPCARPSARLENTTGPADEPALTLRVEFGGDPNCGSGAVLVRYGYQATLEAPPGVYFLHVSHRSVSSEPLTVFASPVAIP